MKRILFVDDEPNILDGLKRMLHPLRAEWRMSFAGSGEQALAMLEETPVDVIVTDMRMPVMDGARLLECVRERFPGVIRIVLSGHFDIEAGLRAVPVAHQFLVKPCDAVKLRGAIDRACHLNELLADEPTRSVVSAIGELPSPPQTCAAVMAALEGRDVSLRDVGAILADDVAVSAKVLQLVNSAFFGLSQEIDDVKVAVTYLGVDLLKQLVLSVTILRAFRPLRPIPGFSLDEFEQHAQFAAEIASGLPLSKSSLSLSTIGARLHDVGKLVLASRLQERFGAAIEMAQREQVPLQTAERAVFGTTHAEIGAYLLGLWALPKPIVAAIVAHHRPPAADASGELDVTAAVRIASALAHERSERTRGLPPEEVLDANYLRSFGLLEQVEGWRRTWSPGVTAD